MSHHCGCCHEHNHHTKSKKGIFTWQNIVFLIGLIAFIFCLIFKTNNFYIELFKFIGCYLILGYQILINCFKSIIKGRIFDENLLMLLASIGAFFLSDYFEGVAVVIFYVVGERFQDFAVEKSTEKIQKSLDFLPKTAQKADGSQIETKAIQIGDILSIKAGERVPVDGKLLSAPAFLNTSMLSGESMPSYILEGETVLSGYTATDTAILLEVTTTLENSAASKIIDMVSEAATNKSKSENAITKFARIYTPCIMGIAVLLAIFLPLITGELFTAHLKTALVFLVIACPCALVISVPLCFFYGIGEAAKIGALVKGGNYLSTLGGVDTVIFDKTGTLTEDKFIITNVVTTSALSKEEVENTISQLEFFSNHPLAKSITLGKEKQNHSFTEIKEIAGEGIYAYMDNKKYFIGKDKQNISNKTCVTLSIDDVLYGYIELECQLLDGTIEAISSLKNAGVRNLYMLTGDKKSVAEDIAKKVGISNILAEKSPSEKLQIVEELCQKNPNRTAYVGDGINDVLAISRADVGISASKLADATTVASDIVLSEGGIAPLAKAVAIAKKTKRKVLINILLSLAIKVGVMSLSFIFPIPLFAAILADVGAALITVLIAMT